MDEVDELISRIDGVLADVEGGNFSAAADFAEEDLARTRPIHEEAENVRTALDWLGGDPSRRVDEFLAREVMEATAAGIPFDDAAAHMQRARKPLMEARQVGSTTSEEQQSVVARQVISESKQAYGDAIRKVREDERVSPDDSPRGRRRRRRARIVAVASAVQKVDRVMAGGWITGYPFDLETAAASAMSEVAGRWSARWK